MYNKEVNRRIGKIGLKRKYPLSVGSDIQNIKLEHNIEFKGSGPFKYLGSFFTNSGKSNEEILNKIEQARKTKRALNNLLWSIYVLVNTKKLMFYTVIESILRYGWEI